MDNIKSGAGQCCALCAERGWCNDHNCLCGHTPQEKTEPKEDSWEEQLRHIWQTTRENEGKYEKVKALFSQAVEEARKNVDTSY